MQDKYARYSQSVTWTQNGPIRASRPASHVASRQSVSPAALFILAAVVIFILAVALAYMM